MNEYIDMVEDRNALHKNHATHRPLSDQNDRVGLSGEFLFGEFTGLWPDTKTRPGGDNGIDFTVLLRFTVDVKTARKPYHLIHENGKAFADIFVLAEYNDETGKARLLGWEWGKVLEKAPTKDFGYGVVNHYIPANKLRPMADLKARLCKP